LNQPLLKIDELRKYYNVSRDTIYRWIKDGCPYVRLPSGHKRFDLAEVAEWCDKTQEHAKLPFEN